MTHSFSPVIAIDGLAATGKGTLARRLAAHLGLAYLDTGVIYRAVAVLLLRQGESKNDPQILDKAAKAAQSLTPALLAKLEKDPLLRAPEGSEMASCTSIHPPVRAALLKFQQDFITSPPNGAAGAVLDGRDIGTVIAPAAKVKIYVHARADVRAHRRFLELQGRGENVTEAQVLADMQVRDERDSKRATAPTKPAEDAVLLDSSDLDADQAFAAALAIVKDKWPEVMPQ